MLESNIFIFFLNLPSACQKELNDLGFLLWQDPR